MVKRVASSKKHRSRASDAHAHKKKSSKTVAKRHPKVSGRKPEPAEQPVAIPPPVRHFQPHELPPRISGYRPPLKDAERGPQALGQPTVTPTVKPPKSDMSFGIFVRAFTGTVSGEVFPVAVSVLCAIGILVGGYFAGTAITRLLMPPRPVLGENDDYIIPESPLKIRSFAECISNGFPIEDGKKRRCHLPDGQYFVERVPTGELPDIKTLQRDDPLIVLSSPTPAVRASQSLAIAGMARIYESPLTVRLKRDGQTLRETSVLTSLPSRRDTDYGDFSLSLSLADIEPGNAEIEVSGSADDSDRKVTIAVPVIVVQ